jgi:GINS complex protein
MDAMTSLYPAFQADDTLIEIIPAFDFDGKIPVHSTVPTGPFKSGMATVVPLWMAIFLQQRSFATICPPAWWTISNLSSIVAFEKKEPSLFLDAKRLPANYFEISKRLSSTTKAVSEHHHALSLLVQDLLDVRVDKLRQQFVDLLKGRETADVMVSVTGIGTQELALLRGVVTQSLADQYYLAQPAPSVDSSTTGAGSAATKDKSRSSLSKTREKAVAPEAGSNVETADDRMTDAATAAGPATATTRRSKLSLRRFRNNTTD